MPGRNIYEIYPISFYKRQGNWGKFKITNIVSIRARVWTQIYYLSSETMLGYFYRLNVYFSMKSMCWNPNLQCDGAFGRWLDDKGGALMNRISILAKEIQESIFILSALLRQWEDGHLWSRKWDPTRYWTCQQLDFVFASLQNCGKYISVVYKPLSLRSFVVSS